MDFVSPEIICSNLNLMIPNAEIWHFGILQSSVHMIWTKTFCGRLESRYRYSKDIVYNNFIWCKPTDEQRKKIEQTAEKILQVRKKYLSNAPESPTTLAKRFARRSQGK